MKCIGLVLLLSFTGCAASQASLEGHDFLHAGLDNLKVGITEYHADDLERLKVARKHLVSAFVIDVVAANGQGPRVEKATTQFLTLLDKAEVAETVEETRYSNMLNSLRALKEVNSKLRNLTQIRLGWKSEAVEYVEQIRRKLEDVKTK